MKLLATRYSSNKPTDNHEDVFKKLERNVIAATKSYKITPYNRDLLVFYAKEHYYFLDLQTNVSFKKFSLNDNTKNIWQPYVRSTTVYEIEGEHSTIFFSSNAKEFAILLQNELDKHN
ncbi:MAG: hypothetical protein ACR2KZ_11035 [Segetibacter sp.]